MPLLIGHGQFAPRVKLSQSEKIVDTIPKNVGKVMFVVYSDEELASPGSTAEVK